MSIHNFSTAQYDNANIYLLAGANTQQQLECYLRKMGASTDNIVASVAEVIQSSEPYLRDCDFETLDQIKENLIRITHVDRNNPSLQIISEVSQRILDIRNDSLEIRDTAVLEACMIPNQDDLAVLENVQIALKRGARIDAKCKAFHSTAFFYACNNGYIKTVNYFLEKGASIHEKNPINNATALMFAAMNGHIDIVVRLINLGASIHEKSYNGNTALMFAAMNGHTETIVRLKYLGASIEDKNFEGATTALMFAAYSGHIETVVKLIELGAWVCNTDKRGKTVLDYAAVGLRKEIPRLAWAVFNRNHWDVMTRISDYIKACDPESIPQLAEVVLENCPKLFAENLDKFVAAGLIIGKKSQLLKAVFKKQCWAFSDWNWPQFAQFLYLFSPEEIQETFGKIGEAEIIEQLSQPMECGQYKGAAAAIFLDFAELHLQKIQPENFDKLKVTIDKLLASISPYTLAAIARKIPQCALAFMPFYTELQRAVVIPLISADEWIPCFNKVPVAFHIDLLRQAVKEQVEAYLEKDFVQLEFLRKLEEIKDKSPRELKEDWLKHHQSIKFAQEQFQQILKGLETLPQFDKLKTYIEEKREYLERLQKELSLKHLEIMELDKKEEIPEEFLDLITMEIMEKPYTQEMIVPGKPVVRTTLDYSTWQILQKTSNSINPFTQKPFRLQDLTLDEELQKRIKNSKI